MEMKLSYKHTLSACYISFICQAIVINFAPLLFLTFREEFSLPLSQITLMITLNFLVQLATDFASIFFIDKIGYRTSAFIAHMLCAAGLFGMARLPDMMPPLAGLIISVVFYSVGAGLIEVLANPIAEACPSTGTEAAFSLLHSFYCWGQVLVVILSSVFFLFFGVKNWRILTLLWAAVPFFNAFCFLFVPINTLNDDGSGKSVRQLFIDRRFWFYTLLMFLAGAAEHSMGQWASAFAESSLGVSKTIGDLLGPCMFAACSGTARVVNSLPIKKPSLLTLMLYCCGITIVSYLAAAFSPIPFLALLACGLCGFGTGILWPGICSLAADSIKNGGTALFAFLALAGDVGCSLGPTAVGLLSGAFGDELSLGIALGTVFPILLIFLIPVLGSRFMKRDLS